MNALLGVSPLLRHVCGPTRNVKVADLHHRRLNAAAAKATDTVSTQQVDWGFVGGFPVQ